MAFDPWSLAITGLTSWWGANQQKQAADRANELISGENEWQREKEAPIVAGGQEALYGGYWIDAEGNQVPAGTEGAKWRSQFQNYLDQGAQSATAAGNIGQQYLGNVPYQQELGRLGMQGQTEQAGWTFNPETNQYERVDTYQRDKDAIDRYFEDYSQKRLDLDREAIGREAADAERDLSRQQGAFGALSSQKGRSQAYIAQAKQQAEDQALQSAYDTAYDRYNTDFSRNNALNAQLAAWDAAGISNAGYASNLAQGAVNFGVGLPFQPYQQYGQTVGASAPQNYNFATAPNPWAYAGSAVLGAWNQGR